jgi:polyhydroxybutyrate depolymerase
MHVRTRTILRSAASLAAMALVVVAPLTEAGVGLEATPPSDTAAHPVTTTHPAETGASGQKCSSTVPTGTSWVDVAHDGEEYPVRVHVPESASGTRTVPMVLNLHYSNGNAEKVSAYNDLDRTADKYGFITVAPNAAIPASEPNPDQIWLWNVPGVPTTAGAYPPHGARDDVAFLTAVIDTMTRNGCADARRVYVAGHSGGARMASAYACARPDKIAAIAPVAGLRAGRPSPADPQALELQSCRPSRPVPVITFHGDRDTTNPYQGNTDKRWGYTIQLAVQTWARLDGCTNGPAVTAVSDHVTRELYSGCARGSQVELYKVSGGTHSWPGSPQDSSATQEIDANELIWEFFAQHTR